MPSESSGWQDLDRRLKMRTTWVSAHNWTGWLSIPTSDNLQKSCLHWESLKSAANTIHKRSSCFYFGKCGKQHNNNNNNIKEQLLIITPLVQVCLGFFVNVMFFVLFQIVHWVGLVKKRIWMRLKEIAYEQGCGEAVLCLLLLPFLHKLWPLSWQSKWLHNFLWL